MTTKHAFEPDYAIAPGATLREILDERDVSQSDLALRMGLTEKTISQIVNGVAPISYDTANRLELVLGVPSRFWNARESQYRESLAKIDESHRLQTEIDWLREVPYRILIERGFIQNSKNKSVLIRNVLAFFGVSSVESWKSYWVMSQVRFRGEAARKDRPGYAAAWVRIGELRAEKLDCRPYDERDFKNALESLRHLTKQPIQVWQHSLPKFCAAAGVAVVIVPEIVGAHVSGVAKWLSKDKALILLGTNHATEDQFWFTFFHEAAHILKHSKKTVFYEDGDTSNKRIEDEANQWARDFLIPPLYSTRLAMLRSHEDIIALAEAIDISPGIVAGRLQGDGIGRRRLGNELKRDFQWLTSD